MKPFRVVIADSQILFLQSLRKNIEGIPGLEVIGEVCGAPELLKFIKRCHADMIILDISDPQQIETVKEVKRIYPDVKILLLTMDKTKESLLQAIIARADGYMLHENAYSDFITAINKIRKGESYFCSIMAGKMADIIRDELSSKSVRKPLSAKEINVLRLRCESKSCKEIAELLSLSPSTIKNHIANIKKKINLKSKIDLMKYAIEHGYGTSGK